MSIYRFAVPSLLGSSLATMPSNGRRAELDRAFDDFFGVRSTPSGMAADAREDATGYTLELDLPGIAPDAIEVLAQDGVLTVTGKRPVREAAEGETVMFAERSMGEFARRFRLPKAADLDQLSATHAHGVLTVRVGKLVPAQPKRVTVSAA
jgi:HSP20 family protein